MFFYLSLPLVAADFATCGASDEWTAFRGQVLRALPGAPLDAALAKRARGLVKRWKLPAEQWVKMLVGSRMSSASNSEVDPVDSAPGGCGASVDTSRGVLADETNGGFHPYHLLSLANDHSSWKKEDFMRWKRDFCYLGYVVALYIRAGESYAKAEQLTSSSSNETDGHGTAELLSKAQQDLMKASSMLGRCREMDFLDRETWGILSLDIDVNLMRVGGDVPGSFGPWRGMAEEFPAEYKNARQNLWHALSLGAHFRQSVEKQVALGVAQGQLQLGPRPVVRGRAMEVALFAMPVWYVTEFVAGLLLWRFPALAMTIYAAPLGGYNMPRSNELRNLVEPYLEEVAELRPLELVDGYCCDWSVASWEVVLQALQRWVLRLTNDVLICGGPLWICLVLRQARPQLPLLAHCLTFQDLDLPLPFPERVRWVHREVVKTFGRSDSSAVLIQDDLQRVYYSMTYDFSMSGNFTSAGQLSFFQMPYIQARYSQRKAKELIFLREGTTKRWTNSLRGHLWYKKLQQLVAEEHDPNMRWRFLKDEAARIPYTEIAEHVAAIFFPGIGHAKLTLHELRSMAMPTLLPAKSLMYRVEELILDSRQPYSGSYDGCYDKSPALRVAAPWVLPLCGWRRHAYFMEWSSFYRYPYFLQFESIGHLIQLVKSFTLPELWARSVKMRRYNEQRRQEEVRWFTNVLAMLSLSGG
eukprot:s200_g18.t1